MSGVLLIAGCAVAIITLAFGWGYVMSMARERRLRALHARRSHVDGYEEIKRSIPELPDEYGMMIYRSMQDIVRTGFPILPEDDIWKTLELDAGNLDNMIENVLESAKRTYPPN